MGLYIKPEYFQIIHYYFFSLGIFSLTSAFLLPAADIFYYVFIMFYIVHSAISWYVSWFLYKRMKDIYIIKIWKYTMSHVLLTLWSGGLAVGIWYVFDLNYDVMIAPIMLINFFVMFLGMIWYLLKVLKVAEKFFEWRSTRHVGSVKNKVMKFRRKEGLKLVDDSTFKDEFRKHDTVLEGMLLNAEEHLKKEDREGFAATVKDIEMKICEKHIENMRGKIDLLRKGTMSETDRKLIDTYQKLIESYGKKIMEYEKSFGEKF